MFPIAELNCYNPPPPNVSRKIYQVKFAVPMAVHILPLLPLSVIWSPSPQTNGKQSLPEFIHLEASLWWHWNNYNFIIMYISQLLHWWSSDETKAISWRRYGQKLSLPCQVCAMVWVLVRSYVLFASARVP